MPTTALDVPRGNAAGFTRYFKQDFISGFQVFLIALPLCLGISLASGFPPLAGIFTAIIGSLVATFLSNSELTIKGPAAGLIVIVAGCVKDFGGAEAGMDAYEAALAVGVAAAVLQICFSLFRGGILGEFFPASAVHGMLAAIGVIIILKQFPVALGVIGAKGEPLELLREMPHFVMEANPAIAIIGGVSLLVMFLWPLARQHVKLLRPIPAPLVVLLVAIPLGMAFDLLHAHSYVLQGHKYQLSEQYLVDMPDRVFGMFDEIETPDFEVLATAKAWWWVTLFFLIGSLESLLSAKAVDMIDPWRRKTNMNRDMLAVGVGNLCASLVGGLPMISEIVRSRANIDNGARTRFANMWHGVFLLVCVALFPMYLHRIPLASLAAMLVYTGFRLAHPTEFLHVYRIGREQLAIFVTTLVGVLAIDLLAGIAIGIALKFVLHVMNGVPVRSLFKPYLEIEQQGNDTCLIRAHQSAVFSNWIPFRRQLEDVGMVQRQNIVLDLSDTKLVDHSVMEKLNEMQADFEQEGLRLDIIGLDALAPVTNHETSARRNRLTVMKRLTLVAPSGLGAMVEDKLTALGAIGWTSAPCRAIGQRGAFNGADALLSRIEALCSDATCEQVLAMIRRDALPVTATIELVRVLPSSKSAIEAAASLNDSASDLRSLDSRPLESTAAQHG